MDQMSLPMSVPARSQLPPLSSDRNRPTLSSDAQMTLESWGDTARARTLLSGSGPRWMWRHFSPEL